MALFTFLAGSFNEILKRAFNAPRPFWVSNTVESVGEGSTAFGMPSGHSVGALAWLLIPIRVHRRWLWIAFGIVAVMIGLSRISLGAHFPSQVLVGWIVGGLILYADQPVRVGDFFRFGDKMGIVEEVGIRSARIRTLDRTIVAIPNAELVKMPLENFGRRDRIRLRTLLRLRMETTADQLRFLVTRLWQMLERHPKLIRDTGSARLVDLGEYSLDVELVAYAATTDWTEFLAIRQDVFLRVMGLVDEAGARLAVPARLELEAPAPGLDETRAGAAEAQARRWREEGNPLVPEYPEAESGTEGGDPG